MAEFEKTMKDWKHMCNAMERERPHDACSGCPLEGYGCPAIYEDNSHVDFADVEKIVTAWAAEHPKPVYPTWGDWFAERGDLIKLWRNIKVCSEHGTGVIGFLYTTIPADIAEKLGIEPMEAR